MAKARNHSKVIMAKARNYGEMRKPGGRGRPRRDDGHLRVATVVNPSPSPERAFGSLAEAAVGVGITLPVGLEPCACELCCRARAQLIHQPRAERRLATFCCFFHYSTQDENEWIREQPEF
jgi:hypothetical protein